MFAEASQFRGEFYTCLSALRDAMFELVDAVLWSTPGGTRAQYLLKVPS
ncbi:hypothetical protein ABZS83_02265 [Streptomyces sp. NPDC005426]